MSYWPLFGIQSRTLMAVLLSVVVHALLLLGFSDYSMRPASDVRHGQARINPALELVLLKQFKQEARPSLTKTVAKHAPNTAIVMPRQPQSVPIAPPAQLAAVAPSQALADAPQEVSNAGQAADTPSMASKLLAEAAQVNRSEEHVSPLEEHAKQRTVARPDYAYNPQPDYPMLLREQGVGGVVLLRVWVDSEGRPMEIKLAKGSGYRLLDDAALRAVKMWRFIPAQNGEQKLASWVEFPIRFTLNA